MGYRYRKTENRFSTTNGEAVDQFGLSFDGRGGLVSVSGGFSVVLPNAEALLARAFPPKYLWSAGASLPNAYVLDAHEQHARKLFEKVTTARDLYDLMLDAMRGDAWSMRMSVQLATAMRNALVLGASLGLDTTAIHRYAEEYDARYNTRFATDSVREADAFLSGAGPGDLRL
jgi:hypothetical protein